MNDKGKYFFCLVAIVLVVGVGIGSYAYTDYRNNRESVKRVSELAYGDNVDGESSVETKQDVVMVEENASGNTAKVKAAAVDKTSKTNVDVKNLQKANPDIFAWISVPGTVIDYPIAQHPTDDTYYLKHGPEGMKSSYGCPFIETCDSKTMEDYITVVYGHNMNDGSMFAGLHKFEDKKFLNDHREIIITTADHVMTYRIFAAVMYSDAYIPYYFDDSVKADRTAFIKSLGTDIVPKRSIILDDEKVGADKKLIVLSTCDKKLRSNRFLVVGILKQIDGVDVKTK